MPILSVTITFDMDNLGQRKIYTVQTTEVDIMSYTITKYQGKFETAENIPKTGRLVTAQSLFEPKYKAALRNVAAVFVQQQESVYLVSLREMVPEDSKVIVDDKQNICAIPAVAGG